MRVKFIFILLLLATTLQSASGYSCYKSDTKGLTLEPMIKSSKVLFAVRDGVENFAEINLLLLDDKSERIEAMAYIFCGETELGYDCSAECDAGSAKLTDKLGINSISIDLEKFHDKNSNGDDEPEFIAIGKRVSNSIVPTEKVKCPKIIKALYHPQRDNSDTEEKLYVCYNEKKKINGRYKYYGCKLDDQLCIYTDRAYFGHYKNQSDAKAALKRCKRSTPKE